MGREVRSCFVGSVGWRATFHGQFADRAAWRLGFLVDTSYNALNNQVHVLQLVSRHREMFIRHGLDLRDDRHTILILDDDRHIRL